MCLFLKSWYNTLKIGKKIFTLYIIVFSLNQDESIHAATVIFKLQQVPKIYVK